MNMNITTHNGFITVKSVRTSEHRTFRVRTEKWCGEKRVVSLLQGSDNTADYVGFGFVREHNGKLLIDVWKSRSETYRKLATLLEKLDEHTKAGNVEVNFEGTCRVCNRVLTVPESVSSGIGPICAGKKKTLKYRGYTITHNPKPIPVRSFDWDFVHDDYDGAEDSKDDRCGSVESESAAVREIQHLTKGENK